MHRCQHCGVRLTSFDAVCPHCQSARPAPEEVTTADTVSEQGLTPIARFTNAAEAGYFAHELLQWEGLMTYMVAEEHYDALNGYWTTRFLLAAPPETAEESAMALKSMLDAPDLPPRSVAEKPESRKPQPNELPDQERDPFREDLEQMQAPSGISWIPILITLTAGGFAFWGVNQFEAQRGGAPELRKKEDFWRELSSHREPWIQEIKGGGQRRMEVDPKTGAASFHEDRDGDGIFEREFLLRPFVNQ